MVLWVIIQAIFYIYCLDSKSQRASKLHYWFKSYGHFAWICWVESKDYSTLWLLGNHNLYWESPKISTSRHQTPDKGIGTLCGTCGTQEVLKKVLQSTNSGLNQHIDISTYQYQYVKCRGAHCKDFGVFRGTVVFLNNDLSISEVTLVVRRKF